MLMVGTAGSTAGVEEALRNRFKDGEGVQVLSCASAGQWLYLARTAACEINMLHAKLRTKTKTTSEIYWGRSCNWVSMGLHSITHTSTCMVS